MAQVPTNPAAPDVAQSAQPTPGLETHAPAEAFGASVAGQGLDDFAKSLGVASETMSTAALQLQAVNNKTAADAAGTTAIQKQAETESAYRTNNPGLAAQANLPALYKSLDDIRQEGTTGLSPLAATDYQSYTRSMQSRLIGQTVSWAAEQGLHASLGASDGKIAQYQALGAANFSDPDQLHTAIQGIAFEVAYQTQRLGLPAEQGAALLHEKVGQVFQSGIHQALDSGDFLGAQQLFTDHKADMTLGQIDSVAGALKVGANAFVTKGFAEDIAAGLAPKDMLHQVQTGLSSDYLSAVHAHEGTSPDPNSSAQRGFIASTFLSTVKGDPQFAADIQGKTDAQILALRQTNPGLVDRATLSLGRANSRLLPQGMSATNTNVFAMQWFGPGDGPKVLSAPANTPVASIIGEDAARKNGLSNETTGQVLAGIQHRFGTGAFNGTAAPAQPAGPTIAPPPRILPNEDPDLVRTQYDTYITNTAHTLYGDNPPVETAAIQAARARMDINIQAMAAQQNSTFHQLDQWVTSGLPNGKAVGSIGDLPPTQVASLPPALQERLGEDVNRAVGGYGAFKTPAMELEAEKLEGLRYSNPSLFADPSRTNIGAMTLSAADRVKFIGMQGKDASDIAGQQARQRQLQSYMTDPLMASIVKHNFPDRQGDAYNAFLGAVQARVDALSLKEGAAPTKEQISSIAQQLVLSHPTGFLGLGPKASQLDIPAPAHDAITAKYQSLYHRDPTPNELSYAYQRGPGYYAN